MDLLTKQIGSFSYLLPMNIYPNLNTTIATPNFFNLLLKPTATTIIFVVNRFNPFAIHPDYFLTPDPPATFLIPDLPPTSPVKTKPLSLIGPNHHRSSRGWCPWYGAA